MFIVFLSKFQDLFQLSINILATNYLKYLFLITWALGKYFEKLYENYVSFGISNGRPLTQAEHEEKATQLTDLEYCDSKFDGVQDDEDNLSELSSISSNSSCVFCSSTDSQPLTSNALRPRLQRARRKPPSKNTTINISDDEAFEDSDIDPEFKPEEDVRPKPNKFVEYSDEDNHTELVMLQTKLDWPLVFRRKSELPPKVLKLCI